MSCCVGAIAIELARETTEANDRLRIADLARSSKTLQDGSVLYILSVPTIHCGQCITTIERKLSSTAGIASVRANLSLKRISVVLTASNKSPEAILKALDELGYPSQSIEDETDGHIDAEFQTLVRSLAVSGFAAANIMLLSVSVWSGAGPATTELFHFLSALIAIPTVAYAGRPFFRSAYQALSHRRMNMDIPISLGVILATVMSLFESFSGGRHAYFDAAVSLLFFLLIGRTLDHMMRNKARDAVGRLSRLAAKGGLVVSPDGELNYLPLEAIRPGMILRVAAGERVPVDGTVVDGTSDVDRSLVTGESAPLQVTNGTSLEAGTMNLTGALDLRANRDAKDSFLADVLQMMQAAEKGRGQYVRLADSMAKFYSPVVHILALATFMGWMAYTGGNWHMSTTIAISVLIITCPCALGLAVPVAHVLAASRLFSIGVVMKDGSALERLAEIDHVVFDKTGTLTTNFSAIGTCTIPRGQLSEIAKTLALRSIHPAARALASALNEKPLTSLSSIHEIPGCGVEAKIGDKMTRLGRAEWVAEIATLSTLSPNAAGLSFALEGGPIYSVQLDESLRVGAARTVQAFEQNGIVSEVLSGDLERAVKSLSMHAGIAHYRFGLKPGEKLQCLNELSGGGHKTLMVGDGLNDAPALTAAHASMAPASASDTGRMAADFVFTRDDLSAVWQAYRIAKHTGRIVKQNFALALVYNAIAVPLAISGALDPFIAAIAMSTSSILVVGNSMRLNWANIKMQNSAEPKFANSAEKILRPAI